MIKETIHYTDFEGKEAVQVAYFNATKLDAIRLSAAYGAEDENGNKTLTAGLRKIAVSGDDVKMVQVIEDILLTTYGERIPGGNQFNKDPEARKAFEYGPAYAELFVGFMEDPKSFEQFIGNLFVDTTAKDGKKNLLTMVGGTPAPTQK